MSWIWVPVAYLVGAVPFSVWVGRWALHREIRDFGDYNPGATNVFRAGGRIWGVVALVLDYLKGLLPVALALSSNVSPGTPPMVAVAWMPPLGHAFSPFLSFRGGKAVAATFGVWTALIGWPAPMVWGLALGLLWLLLDVDGWAVMLGFLALLVLVLARGSRRG